MYRRYEDPHKVEDLLERAEKRLGEAKAKYADVPDEDYPIDYIADLYNDVESLRERVNFAWQDQEYDENYAHDMGYDREEES